MHVEVLNRVKEVIAISIYLVLILDEITTIDNSSWINVGAYLMVDWD
jgi:hypothetical protein